MRQKRRELIERGQDPLEWSWQEVLRDERPTNHDENWVEGQAREWSKRLVKNFGKTLREHPEIAARALQLYSETLPRELVRCWPDEVQEEIKDLQEMEF